MNKLKKSILDLVGVLILSIPVSLFQAFVLCKIWGWFLQGFTGLNLTLGPAYGVSMFISTMAIARVNLVKPEFVSVNIQSIRLFINFIAYSMVLLGGWIMQFILM